MASSINSLKEDKTLITDVASLLAHRFFAGSFTHETNLELLATNQLFQFHSPTIKRNAINRAERILYKGINEIIELTPDANHLQRQEQESDSSLSIFTSISCTASHAAYSLAIPEQNIEKIIRNWLDVQERLIEDGVENTETWIADLRSNGVDFLPYIDTRLPCILSEYCYQFSREILFKATQLSLKFQKNVVFQKSDKPLFVSHCEKGAYHE